jgi:hypothetical protein
MKTNKKSVLLVCAVLIVLAAAVAVLAWLNYRDDLPDSGTLAVVCGGETLRTFTLEEIQALPAVEVEKEIVSSSFANDEGLFRGVSLRALLRQAGVEPDEYSQLIARAEDNFVMAYPMDEITESDDIFLAYEKNGQGLGSLQDGGTGPLRIIVTQDEFGNRCAKYVCELEVK